MGSDRRPPVQSVYDLIVWLCSSNARIRRLCAVIVAVSIPVVALAVALVVVGASASPGVVALTGIAGSVIGGFAVVRRLLKARTTHGG